LEGLFRPPVQFPPSPFKPLRNPDIFKINNLLLTLTNQAVKVGKEYEARGGSYENEPGSKDKPEKGPPQKKSEATKKAETAKSKSAKKDENGAAGDEEEKPKANEGKKKDEGGEKKKIGRPKKGDEKKPPKEQREGERKSQRMRGNSPLFGSKRRYMGMTGEESAAKKGKVKK
jgi:hypothetical protein